MLNTDTLSNDSCKELLTILSYSSLEIQDSIPDEIYQKLTFSAADSKKNVYINKNKPLYEQNISHEALDMFALLYFNYVANDIEKEEILSSWNNN